MLLMSTLCRPSSPASRSHVFYARKREKYPVEIVQSLPVLVRLHGRAAPIALCRRIAALYKSPASSVSVNWTHTSYERSAALVKHPRPAERPSERNIVQVLENARRTHPHGRPTAQMRRLRPDPPPPPHPPISLSSPAFCASSSTRMAVHERGSPERPFARGYAPNCRRGLARTFHARNKASHDLRPCLKTHLKVAFHGRV
ncbi:hypothetical protein C8Q77DRAFT_484004 [Trametes polyzona]|nr:hypothetical protein C8Q77DRAFT_484004 [Trametes polyzona]